MRPVGSVEAVWKPPARYWAGDGLQTPATCPAQTDGSAKRSLAPPARTGSREPQRACAGCRGATPDASRPRASWAIGRRLVGPGDV